MHIFTRLLTNILEACDFGGTMTEITPSEKVVPVRPASFLPALCPRCLREEGHTYTVSVPPGWGGAEKTKKSLTHIT